MALFPGHAIRWLTVLFSSIILSILGTTLPNKFRQGVSWRSHNSIKLFNECLARHQLAYFTYFLALLNSQEFGADKEVFNYALIISIVLTTFFYVDAVYQS